MKQTAVEWLVAQVMKIEISKIKGEISTEKMIDLLYEKLRQAKKMEKEQIMNAWLTTRPTTLNYWRDEFEQYYNETFKSE